MEKLLTEKMYNSILNTNLIDEIYEIRVRLDKPLVVKTINSRMIVTNIANKMPYIVDKFDIKHILDIASNHSMYSVEDKLIQGYLTYGNGIRIAVLGRVIYVDNKIKTIVDINGFVIRISKQIFGIADNIYKTIFKNNELKNTLIISKPSFGKTTMLRELTRCISDNGVDTLIIDEKNEIAGVANGYPTFDIGSNSDVITNINKADALENAIRTCNPKLIIIDEIFNENELKELYKIAFCGVNIIATRHIESIDMIKKDICYNLIKQLFEYIVVLDNKQIGKIEKIINIKDV